MTKRDVEPWVTGDSDSDRLLARVLASSEQDEPTAARVEALVAHVALAATLGPPAALAMHAAKGAGAVAKGAGAVAKGAGAVAKATLVTKLAAVIGAGALAGPAVWYIAATSDAGVDAHVRTAAPRPRSSEVAHPPTIRDSGLSEVSQPAEASDAGAVPAMPAQAPHRRVRSVRPPESGATAAREDAREAPQLERELRLLTAMRAALTTDPCTTLRLAEQHCAEFAAPVLAPEREQLVRAAREVRAASDASACVP